MEKFFVKPAIAGLRVFDIAAGIPLPETGAWKPRSQYWLRRLTQGEIVETTPPIETAPLKSSAPADQPKSTKAKG